MDTEHAVIVGAQGVIGRNLAGHLLKQGWRVTGLSRRGGEATERQTHIAVDLLDEADTRSKLAHLRNVSHVFYAAYQDRPSWAELVAPNMAMLRNSIDTIEAASPTTLRHVSLMQGYKVYGAHLGPFATPAREEDGGRHMPPEFNVDQQDFLRTRQQGKSWTWSAIRPSVVGGYALGNPMNLAVAIAVYASISKELGLPLRFPGKPGAYGRLLEMTDAGLLAQATVWAATMPAGANEAFNIANGDLFRWSSMWPRIARYFELELAPPLPLQLATVMTDKAPLWQQMQAKYGLASHDYRHELSPWSFADFVFSWDYDMFADTSKSRRAGFHSYVETEAMFIAIFDDLRRRKVIP
jgi:nucleoside-diphosphate-sugar epimerase